MAGKLKPLEVERETKPGKYADGDGLYLIVAGPTSKNWDFRFWKDGKERWHGLGSFKDVSLKEARLARDAARLRSAVPASLGLQVQAEVIASMSLAVIEGRIHPGQIEASVRNFVRDYYRQFSNYGPISLDRPLFEDSSLTIGDTVTRGLWG